MKNIFKNYWTREKARFMRHPYFWTIYTIALVLWIVIDAGVAIQKIEKVSE